MFRNRKFTALLILAALLLPVLASAQTLEKTGLEGICSKDAGGEFALGKCVQQLYLFSLGLGALLALLMIVLSGYRYMTAAGNAQQVDGAKESFASAFIGLIILFIAYLLLYTINPDLVKFQNKSINRLELPTFKEPSATPPDIATITGEPVDLAKSILAKSNKIRLATSHALCSIDNATALKNIQDTAAGKEAARSNCRPDTKIAPAPGGTVALSASMLKGMLQVAEGFASSITISEIAGGQHSGDSKHYKGTAFDINQVGGAGININNPDFRTVKAKCTAAGATLVRGPGDSGHDTHVHCEW